ncbi:MAG: GntR family transcriptional regulator [Comamonas sp.]
MDIAFTSAEQEAYDYVLQRIRSGAYPSGERLIAEDIANAIAVSRMPVRVAFRRLATEGLLVLRQNRGAVVRGINVAEMREVFEMRAVLEGHAAQVAMAHVGEQEVWELSKLLERMDASADAQQWVTHHRHFHEYISNLSGRSRLIAQISALHSFVEPHMRLWMEHSDKPRDEPPDHDALLDAFRRRDAEGIARMVHDHIVATIAPLERLMTRDKPIS